MTRSRGGGVGGAARPEREASHEAPERDPGPPGLAVVGARTSDPGPPGPGAGLQALLLALEEAGLRSVQLAAAPQGASLTLEVDDGALRSGCTCGAASPCVHVRAALEALGFHHPDTAPAEAPVEPGGQRLDIRTAAADVCAAAVASGLDRGAPALLEALARLSQALRVDHRPDARRAWSRLVDALEQGKVHKAARSLVELSWVARSAGQVDRRSELTLIEIGRDTGSDALGRWDETFFVDLGRGELLVEGAPVLPGREPQMSVGPYPRTIFGQLVDIEPGRSPRRIRLIQYEQRGAPDDAGIDRLVATALPDLEAVRAAASTGTSLVLARAARLGTLDGAPALVDGRGRALPLALGARALTAALVELAKAHTLRAVLGRVGLAEPGHLEVRPLAAIVDHQLVRLA